MPFTPAQQQAIEADNRDLLVSAAAGSGKTAVLVQRILRLIRQKGMSVERMLIVTFTRAAAGEMRQRLETLLTDAAQTEPALLKQAELVSTAQISTIHSFCQQVVRQNFQHCEVDPQFMLLDERTRATLYDQSMQLTLDHLYTLAAQDEDMAALTIRFPEREIVAMLNELYSFLMSRPDPMGWLQTHTQKQWRLHSLNDEPMARAFCAEAGLIIGSMRALWQKSQQMSQDPAFPAPYLATLQADNEPIALLEDACAQGMTHLMQAMGQLSFARLPRFKPTTTDEEQLAARFRDHRDRIKAVVKELQKLLPADPAAALADLKAMEPATRGLGKAAQMLHSEFTAAKRQRAATDFNDLEHMTLSVLQNEALSAPIRGKFDAVFVDEYQDVSQLQEAILNGLRRKDDPSQMYFYVGDVKQSIYRFRQAEPALFLGKLAGFGADVGDAQRKIVLNRNFRSRTAVLDAVNRVFAHVMHSRVTEIDYDDDAKLYPGIPSQNDPATELHILAAEDHRPADMVQHEAELIAQHILHTVGKPRFAADGTPMEPFALRDVAILMPAAKGVADQVEKTLLRHRIPVYCENSADAMDSDEVGRVAQHLSLLDNLMNDVALLGELRSPIFDMTEGELARVRLLKPEREATYLAAVQHAAQHADEPLRSRCAHVLSTLERERFYARSMPLSEYLWDFLHRSGLYAHYGAQPGGKLRQANLRMLCTRAADYEKTHTDGLGGFARTLLSDAPGGGESGPTVVSPWENVVRIMTIHKSKGLEFPVVYVMGLGRSLSNRERTRAISLHGEVGVGLQYVNHDMRIKRRTLTQGAISLRERNAERAERARLLYVALTRPKDLLVMVGSQKGVDFDALTARAAAGDMPDLHTVRSAHTYLDWIMDCVGPQDRLTAFSTLEEWKTHVSAAFSSFSTIYPQAWYGWQVFFHTNMDVKKVKKQDALPFELPVPQAAPPQGDAPAGLAARPGTARAQDPIAPVLRFEHPPLKLGVTALCRAMAGHPEDMDDPETPDTKRLPLIDSRPRLLGSLPTQPAFLAPPQQQMGLAVGVQTHRLLGLMDLDALRACGGDYVPCLRTQLSDFVARGVMRPEEAQLADLALVERFLRSELGARMLASDTVMREWSFNLRITSPIDTILQGVIDLCFLEDGAWVLVDHKTDHLADDEAFVERYGQQLSWYRRALEAGTSFPVRECVIFALRKGVEVGLRG